MAGEVYTVRVHHEPGEELWAKSLSCPAVSPPVPTWWSYGRL
jgi:hypothetical protein